jgi:hypothetical protein
MTAIRKKIAEGTADKHTAVMHYTLLWEKAKDADKEFLQEMLLRLAGAAPKAPQASEPNKHIGPVAQPDPDLDSLLRKMKGGQ